MTREIDTCRICHQERSLDDLAKIPKPVKIHHTGGIIPDGSGKHVYVCWEHLYQLIERAFDPLWFDRWFQAQEEAKA